MAWMHQISIIGAPGCGLIKPQENMGYSHDLYTSVQDHVPGPCLMGWHKIGNFWKGSAPRVGPFSYLDTGEKANRATLQYFFSLYLPQLENGSTFFISTPIGKWIHPESLTFSKCPIFEPP